MSTAQGVGAGKVTFGKAKRQAAVRAHLVAAHAHTEATLNRPFAPKNTDALTFVKSQLGLGYAITGCRCSPYPCYKRDCSGVIYAAINAAFLNYGMPSNLCGSSFSLAAWGRDWGTEVSEETAINTPFALGVRCAFCDPNFNGSNGHVVAMVGDGLHTYEEGGHATGCYEGWAQGRGFDFWMTVPSLDYSITPTYASGDSMSFIQAYHYDPKTGKQTKPATDTTAKEDLPNLPVVEIAKDGLSVVAKYGASISGDHADDATKPYHVRRWYPGSPLPSGERFVSLSPPVVLDGEVLPSSAVSVSDGSNRRFRLS